MTQPRFPAVSNRRNVVVLSDLSSEWSSRLELAAVVVDLFFNVNKRVWFEDLAFTAGARSTIWGQISRIGSIRRVTEVYRPEDISSKGFKAWPRWKAHVCRMKRTEA